MTKNQGTGFRDQGAVISWQPTPDNCHLVCDLEFVYWNFKIIYRRWI